MFDFKTMFNLHYYSCSGWYITPRVCRQRTREWWKTWSTPRCPLRSHYLVHRKKNSYFLGIGPILDVELTCMFRPIFLIVYCTENRYQDYNKKTYTSVLKCFNRNIELYFVPYFVAKFETMFILKVYVYLTFIKTQ